MVKKTAKPSKSNQQRAREEQWRRRVAAQGGAVSGATLDRESASIAPDGAETTNTPRAATPARAASTPRSRMVSPSMGAAQRRPMQPARSSRLRMAANLMSIDDEMHYVRSDIRRLILLTAACLVVLVALSFIIR